MDRVETFRTLLEDWQRVGLDRRQFLRLVAVGTSATALSAMIAACGGDDDDDSDESPTEGASSGGESPTATTGEATGGGDATEAEDEATTAEGDATSAEGDATSASGGEVPEGGEQAMQPTAAPFVDREFVVALNVEPDNLHAHNTTSNASASVDKCIYEGLVYLDENMRPVNLLAESWEPSDDAKEFTFYLREGITFHDGTPLNAEAVKAAFDNTLQDQSLKRHSYFTAFIDHIEVIDELTVKFVAPAPFAAMIASLAHPAGGVPSPTALEEFGEDFGINPVGTGPYRFVEWVRGDHITLEANPDYWDATIGPSVSRLTVRGIAEPSALGLAIQSGDAQFGGPISATQAEQLEQGSDVEVLTTEGMSVFWVTLNTQIEPFNNLQVRQALNHAINKEAVLETAALGRGYVMDSVLAKAVWGYSSVMTYEYDTDKAKQLLADAGYPDGFEANLWCTANSRPDAVVVQGMLSEIGVDIEVVQMESAALSEELAKPMEESNTQMVMSNWSPSTGDADWAIRPLYAKAQWPPAGSNRAFYENEELEGYIQQGLELIDPEERAAAYAEAQKLIMEDAVGIWTYVADRLGAIREEAGGCTVQADGVAYLRTAYYKEG